MTPGKAGVMGIEGLLLLSHLALAPGPSTTEFHLLLCPPDSKTSYREIADRFGLKSSDDEAWEATYFDTANLSDSKDGLAIRLRIFRDTKSAAQKNAKLNIKLALDQVPSNAGNVDCEFDRYGNESPTLHCSLNSSLDKPNNLIQRPDTLPKALSREQRKFLDVAGPTHWDSAPRRAFGPLQVSRNESDFNLEVWGFPDGTHTTEISLRAPTSRADSSMARLRKLAADAGYAACAQQGSKTRDALLKLAQP